MFLKIMLKLISTIKKIKNSCSKFSPLMTIEKVQMSDRVLSVYANENLYIGVGSRFINYSFGNVLCCHEKSIRSISGNGQWIGCASYDGTATIFDKNTERIKDKIEGPETEIKSISFFHNLIAISTRGKTTWVLEDFEVSKILEDHTQDVKGCTFNSQRLYTWSYDNSIKVYEMFDYDNSWEITQSIDLDDIVWNIAFFGEYLCAGLQNGKLEIFKMEKGLWTSFKSLKLSGAPIYALCVADDEYLCVVCNRNCLVLLSKDFNIAKTYENLNDGCDIFSICFWKKEHKIIAGSDDGTLTFVSL